MAEIETWIRVVVGPLLCREPFFGSDTLVGLSVPPGGDIVAHELTVGDADSNGFTSAGIRPNLVVQERAFQDTDDRRFVGWWISNTDENLERLYIAHFKWTGGGPPTVQSEVGNVKGCGGREYNQRVEVGIILPNDTEPQSFSNTVREPGGAWVGALDRFFTASGPQGIAGGIQTANRRIWSWFFTNSHPTFARAIRVRANL